MLSSAFDQHSDIRKETIRDNDITMIEEEESPNSLNIHDGSQCYLSSSNGDLSTSSYFSYETGFSSENGNGDHLVRRPSIGTNTSWTSSGSLKRSTSRVVLSDAEMSHAQQKPLTLTKCFGHDMNKYTEGSPDVPTFDKSLRRFIEPHISKARKSREDRRCLIMDKLGLEPRIVESLSITSKGYVPYPSLRKERPFLFDVETYPLHQKLAETLGISDLSRIHEHYIKDKKLLVSPLLDPKKRRAFHQRYDNFVLTFCIPLLHSLAMVQKLLTDFSREPGRQRICYRYQAFPCLRIIRPGEFSIGPHCDMAYGHSMGNINFHIPLTPTFGTNCLFTESRPGREDWHPLKTKSVGLGFAFDGARCLHYTLENTTQRTRVSLDFRIAIYRERSVSASIGPQVKSKQKLIEHGIQVPSNEKEEEEDECDVNDILCNQKLLQDNYSKFPGYYEEAYIDLESHYTSPDAIQESMVQKKNKLLMHPDKRVGFPF
jgi:hypothetical protein